MSSASSAPKFSYAQAARSASNPPSAATSKSPSGQATPAKDQGSYPALKSELNGQKWSDSVDEDAKALSIQSSSSTAVDAQSTTSLKSPTSGPVRQPHRVGSPGPVDFGMASTGTLVQDDAGAASPEIPEATWETKSYPTVASKADGRQSGSSERASSRGRKKGAKKGDKKEKEGDAASKDNWRPAPPVTYVDAPLPIVNPWGIKKASITPAPPKPSVTSDPSPTTVEKPATIAREEAKPTPPSASGTAEKKPVEAPIPRKVETSTSQTKEVPKSAKLAEKIAEKPSEKPATKMVSPVVDQAAWPTPDTAQVAQAEEQKKKPLEKPESEHQPSPPVPKGKNAWEKIDFTPSVVFTTPLPGAARRGGKSGNARGGREGGDRPGAPRSNERRGETSSDGDASRRERGDGSIRGSSPGKAKRFSYDESASRRPSRQENSLRESSGRLAPQEERPKSGDSAEQRFNSYKPKSNRREAAMTNGEKPKQATNAIQEGQAAAPAKSSHSSAGPASHQAPWQKKDKEISPATSERKSSVSMETPPSTFHDTRKSNGSYSVYNGRERSERGGRAGHRGGRGGAGGQFDSHAHIYNNGQYPTNAYPTPGYGGPPRSPGFGSDPYFGYPVNPRYNGRGGFSQRAPSLPMDPSYTRMQNGFGGPLQINTGIPGNGMFPPDYFVPATAVPQPDPVSNLIQAVAQQLEYYFSMNNLLKDMFLRKHMDSQGFVLLSFIAGFKRIDNMTKDLELLKYVCQNSPNIEHFVGSDGLDRLRSAQNWQGMVLPKEERDPSAQHDGPESLHRPPPARPNFDAIQGLARHGSLPNPPQSAGPVLGGPPYQTMNGFAPYGFGPNTMIDTPPTSRFQTSPASATTEQAVPQASLPPFTGNMPQPPPFPNGTEDHESDTFRDEEVAHLRLVVRDQAPAELPADISNRNLSNGFINGLDGLMITTPPAGTATNGASNEPDSRTSPVPSERVNHFLVNSSRETPNRNTSRTSAPSDSSPEGSGVYWIKNVDSPAHEMPPNTSSDLYLVARQKAFEQRQFQAVPHEMEVLYQFWSHFLVRNFNQRMYMEFRAFAFEDAAHRNNRAGMDHLLTYYSAALSAEGSIRKIVAFDYVELVKTEPRESSRPAFKALRNAWRNGALNMKNRKRIKDFLDAQLEAELDR